MLRKTVPDPHSGDWKSSINQSITRSKSYRFDKQTPTNGTENKKYVPSNSESVQFNCFILITSRSSSSKSAAVYKIS